MSSREAFENETGHSCPVTNHACGAASFRLKPQLVIGDQLVPMPEREAPAMGTPYFTPSLHKSENYIEVIWGDTVLDRLWLERGLIHLDKEAAIAHGEALVALSKKKD